jgi:hypothetical protein
MIKNNKPEVKRLVVNELSHIKIAKNIPVKRAM